MKSYGSIVALSGLVGLVHGHGFVTSPKARMPGSAMAAACGQQVEINQNSDNYGNIQGELQVAKGQSDYDAAKCDIWLCKGYKFDDNKDNVQTYTSGQVIPFTVDVRAPHTGVANVSIVDTASNSVIGSALKSWDVYASTATGVKDTDKSFSITMPDVSSQCSEAGACVIQWYWYAESIDQTYESCVDFTMGGSGSSSGSSGSSSAATSAAASTPAVSSVAVAAVQSTLATSTTPAPAATTPATTAAAGGSNLASELEAAFPSSVLTQTIPTPTATTGVVPDQSLPSGTTVQDLVDWFVYLVNNMGSGSNNQRRHARDVARRV